MRADEALVAEDDALLAANALPKVAAPSEDAPVDAHRRSEVAVVVDDRTLQDGVVADAHVAPEGAVAPEVGLGADDAVVADDGRAVDHDARVDLRALAEPDSGTELEAAQLDLDALVEDVLVRLQIGLERAHVLPVAVGHISEQRLLGLERGGERVAREVDRAILGDEVEDLRLEHVDAGVDGVAEDLAPRRLLEEANDRAVLGR